MERFNSLGAIIALLIIVVCLVLALVPGGLDIRIAALIGLTALTRLV